MRRILLSLTAGAALTLVCAMWRVEAATAKVEETKVQISGVCRVSPDAIECWKPDGSPDKRDSEFATAYFVANPDHKMQVALGRRTRLIVTREVTQAYISFDPSNGLIDSDEHRLALVNYGGTGSVGQESVRIYWYYPANDASVAKLELTGPIDTGVAPKIDLKSGATAKFPGFTVKVGSIKAVDLRHDLARGPFPNITGPEWTIDLSLDPPNPADGPISSSALPFDSTDQQIVSVDPRADPVTPEPQEFLQTVVWDDSRARGTPRLRSRVRPDRVKYLVLTATTTKRVTLGEVKLEPSGTHVSN